MSQRLAGQRALITGGASGIGRAIAHAFNEAGAMLALVDYDADQLDETAADLDGEPTQVVCDVRDGDAVTDCVGEAVDALGGLDVLVNNAGVITRKELVDTSEAELQGMVETNLNGAVRVTREAIPALTSSEGSIINVSSIASVQGSPDRSVYSATKGGINGLTHQLAVELAPEVRVNAIAPGTIDTPLNRQSHEDESYVQEKLSKIPLGRFGTPEDVAGPAVFLASDAAGYVTGHVLFVDGGRASS